MIENTEFPDRPEGNRNNLSDDEYDESDRLTSNNYGLSRRTNNSDNVESTQDT